MTPTPPGCRRFIGKVAYISGGANGIGRATVERLAREGAAVTFCDVAEKEGFELQERLTAEGLDVRFLRCDATDEAAVAAAVAEARKWRGQLNIGINNVGSPSPGDPRGAAIHCVSLETWDKTLHFTLRSTLVGMKYQIAAFLEQGGGGVIANTSSMAGLRVTPHGTAAYSAAKAGVVQLTRFAAVLYAPQNIRANCIAPGLTLTGPILRNFTPEGRAAARSEFHALDYDVLPEDQAAALAWVCSDDARAVTGHTIPVDGGWAAR